MGQAANSKMEISKPEKYMPEATNMSVNSRSTENRSEIDQLGQGIGNMNIFSKKGTICEAGLKNRCNKGKICEFFHQDISQMPGCYMCLKYNTCSDKNCVWCVRGFCHNGQLCNNIYAQYLYYNEKDEYCSIGGILMEQKSRS